ncbi:MMPL family transporter [Salipaludibacillus sp. CUR1]|uniref:MMPL family transporter n=1 Tax=Salipaludibacillus sp. CUR1 TaxID=2820003 RepID=UPI001E3D5299|nr:MMPL family transporter [Salipaludibacillus sp. CUR1]MCE7791791.1 MMPL family transporter [Salipaludibacillus sp. CUR1]
MKKLNKRSLIYIIPFVWLAVVVIAYFFPPDIDKFVREQGQESPPDGYPSTLVDPLIESDGGFTGEEVIVVYQEDDGITDDLQTDIKETLEELENNPGDLPIHDIITPFDGEEQEEQLLSDEEDVLLAILELEIESSDFQFIRDDINDKTEVEGIDHYLTGAVVIDEDVNVSTEEGLETSTYITVILVFTVLAIVFRSPVAPIIPLLLLGSVYLASIGAVSFLIDNFGFPVSNFTQIFVLTVVFGVGTDYCILVMKRFQTELSEDDDKNNAMKRTMAGSRKTVLYSAFTGWIGFTAIGLADFELYRSAVGVAVGMIFLMAGLWAVMPAMLGLMGPLLFWPSKVSAASANNRFWGALGSFSIFRPKTALIVVVIIMIPLLFFYDNARSFDSIEEIQGDFDSVKAYDYIDEAFGEGEMFFATIVLRTDESWKKSEHVPYLEQTAMNISKLEGVDSVRTVSRPLGDTQEEFTIPYQAGELSDGLDEAIDGLEELENGLQEMQEEVENSEEDIDEAEEGILELIDGTSEAIEGVREIRAGLVELADELAEAEQEVRDTQNQIDEYRQEVAAVEQDVQDIQETIEDARNLAEEVIDDAEERISEIQNQAEEFQARGEAIITDAEESIENVRELFDEADIPFEELQSLDLDSDFDLTDAESFINSVLNQFEEIDQQMSSTIDQVEEAFSDLNFDNILTELRNELTNTLTGLDLLETEDFLNNINEFFNDLEDEYSDLLGSLPIPGFVEDPELLESIEQWLSEVDDLLAGLPLDMEIEDFDFIDLDSAVLEEFSREAEDLVDRIRLRISDLQEGLEEADLEEELNRLSEDLDELANLINDYLTVDLGALFSEDIRLFDGIFEGISELEDDIASLADLVPDISSAEAEEFFSGITSELEQLETDISKVLNNLTEMSVSELADLFQETDSVFNQIETDLRDYLEDISHVLENAEADEAFGRETEGELQAVQASAGHIANDGGIELLDEAGELSDNLSDRVSDIVKAMNETSERFSDLIGELENLQEKLSFLPAVNDFLNENLAEFADLISGLPERKVINPDELVDSLIEYLDQVDAYLAALPEALPEIFPEMDLPDLDYTGLTDLITEAEAAVQDLRGRIARLEDTLSEADLEEELTAIFDDLELLDRLVNQLEEAAAESLAAGVTALFDNLADEFSLLEEQLADISETVPDLDLEEIDEFFDEVYGQFEQIEAAISGIIDNLPDFSIDELTDTIEQAMNDFNRIENDVREFISDIENAYEELAGDLDGLDLEDELESLVPETDIPDPDDFFDDIYEEFDNAEEQITELADGLEEAVTALNEAVEGLDELEEGLLEIQQGQQELLEGLDMVRDAVDELTEGLEEAREGADEINEGLQEAQELLDEIADQPSNPLEGFFVPEEAMEEDDFQEAWDTYVTPEDHNVAFIEATLDYDPYSHEAMDLLYEIEYIVDFSLNDTPFDEADMAIGGIMSDNRDLRDVSTNDFIRTAVIMLFGIFFALIVQFKSLVMPLIVLISLVGSYFGAVSITEYLFTTFFGSDGLMWAVPFFGFALLTALGVDYSIFLLGRMTEIYENGDTDENEEGSRGTAVQNALFLSMKRVGGTVLSAALILGGTFASMIPSGVLTLLQISILTITGLLFYTLIILPLFVPASIALFGRFSWWPLMKNKEKE